MRRPLGITLIGIQLAALGFFFLTLGAYGMTGRGEVPVGAISRLLGVQLGPRSGPYMLGSILCLVSSAILLISSAFLMLGSLWALYLAASMNLLLTIFGVLRGFSRSADSIVYIALGLPPTAYLILSKSARSYIKLARWRLVGLRKSPPSKSES